MLSMLEEVVLLAVDEKTGRLRTAQGLGTGYALAGAVFFDLALAKKIDTDIKSVQLIDATPTGVPIVDQVLSDMARDKEPKTVRSWVEKLKRHEQALEDCALQMLIDRGILRHEMSKRLWVIDVERFPSVDNKPLLHVKFRLAQAILTDNIPDARDTMLVSIAQACGLLGLVLTREELNLRRERIQVLCGLETISRAVAEAIAELDYNIRSVWIQPF